MSTGKRGSARGSQSSAGSGPDQQEITNQLLKELIQVTKKQQKTLDELKRESEDFRKDLRALSLVQQWSMDNVSEQLK